MENFLKLVPGNAEKLKRNEELQKANAVHQEESQQPWVEKYRPNSLNDIVYQETVVNSLRKTKATGKMQHLLFYGPPGTGKTSTIIALAKEIFGPSYRERILELNASDERGIAVVRDKIKKFSQKRISKISTNTKANFQIVILDEADSMTTDAQSALRRIIEDYTEQTRFCIICNYVSKIIDPIASRCARQRFSPLSKESQINRLKYIAEKEKVCVGDAIIKLLVEVSEGDLRRSINLLQSISQLGSDLLNEEIINDVCGIIPKNIVGNIIESCKESNTDRLLAKANEFLVGGYDMRQLLVQLNDYIASEESINDFQKQKIFAVLMDKETMLLENSSCEILAYDLFVELSEILKGK